MRNVLARDLDEIIDRNREDFAALRGARVFLTGGTGFVGTWLVESFVWANRRLALGARLEVLARDPERFSAVAPHLASDEAITIVRGDVLALPSIAGPFDAVLHVATTASARLNDEEPLVMIDTVACGTRNVLELAAQWGAVPFLFTSSGAVYGRQPPELPLIDELYSGGPLLEARFAYHESKRLAELLCAVVERTGPLKPKIARLFAFVGPHLPIDLHFAVGNFIRDALAGGPIIIGGDGTPIRTYLYAGDLTSWLWRILLAGEPMRAYNVGSEDIISIEGVARAVACAVQPQADVVRRGEPTLRSLPERYACSTARARTELSLEEWTPLNESLRRTLDWHRKHG